MQRNQAPTYRDVQQIKKKLSDTFSVQPLALCLNNSSFSTTSLLEECEPFRTAILKQKTNFMEQQRTKTQMLSWHKRCRTWTFVSSSSNFKEFHCGWFYNIVKVNTKEQKLGLKMQFTVQFSYVLLNGHKSEAIKPLWSRPVPRICVYSFQC